MYNKFINWLDQKLKMNRLLSCVLGMVIILCSFYFTRNVETHTVNNSMIDYIILSGGCMVGVLFLTLAKFGKGHEEID